MFNIEVEGVHTYVAEGFVVHNCHHVPCETLGTVLYDLPGQWRLGLTATPERSDGLTPWLHAHIGPTVATVERAALVRAGVVLAPTVRPVRTEWAPGERDDHAAMMEGATTDEGRLDLVVRLASRLASQGRHVLVQTERVGHAEAIAERVAASGVAAAAVHAKLSSKERVRRLAACASGELRVLCATQLADEGLDMPSLDALILAVPQRNPGRLEQRVGRVSRSAPGKTTADVYDLVDGGWAGKLWWARRKVYQRLGCAIADEVRGA